MKNFMMAFCAWMESLEDGRGLGSYTEPAVCQAYFQWHTMKGGDVECIAVYADMSLTVDSFVVNNVICTGQAGMQKQNADC
jgi:hypothetical protein